MLLLLNIEKRRVLQWILDYSLHIHSLTAGFKHDVPKPRHFFRNENQISQKDIYCGNIFRYFIARIVQ